jgi:hypothetical protein
MEKFSVPRHAAGTAAKEAKKGNIVSSGRGNHCSAVMVTALPLWPKAIMTFSAAWRHECYAMNRANPRKEILYD